jgi:replicative DNA helicase
MSRKKLYQLLACNIAGIDSNLIDLKTIDERQKELYIDALTKIYDKELYIDDSTRSWEEIKNKIKIFKKERNIEIVYLDYMQYLRVKDVKLAYERLEIISSDTKELNKKLQIPICHIVTLNREGKKEAEPQSYHIKGNGDIEYDADIIILLKTINEKIEGDANKRFVQFFVKKNRNGRRGDFNMIFKTDVRRFFEEEKYLTKPST